MILVAKRSARRKPIPSWHAQFLALVPRIPCLRQAQFRRAAPELQEELVEEAVANCLLAFVRLIELGKGDQVFAGVLARYGIAQVRQGRRVGSPLNVHDALSQYAQHRQGFTVDRLDHYDDTESAWQEIMIEDRRCTPADLAASRIDFAEWLHRLPFRQRRIAKVLATGERTAEVAKRFGVSAGRVSQMREELRDSWEAFQSGRKSISNEVCSVT